MDFLLSDIAQILGLNRRGLDTKPIQGISIDSRTLQPGMVFVALKGNHLDGHAFVKEAFSKGAVAAIVEKNRLPVDAFPGKVLLEVSNSLLALQQLAKAYRKKFTFPVIAVTGSNGKTTTKEMIAQILKTQFHTFKTSRNLNNHIGVPLSICQWESGGEISVMEMGANHFGEIRTLCEIAQPTHGVITNVGKAHLEGFGDIHGVLRAKIELLEYLQHSGTAFLNGDDPLLQKVQSMVHHTITFGFGTTCDVRGIPLESKNEESLFMEVEGHGILLPMKGKHNLYNALASIAVVRSFNIPWECIQKALSEFTPPEMRMEWISLPNGVIVINDAYNANPSSMEKGLREFAAIPQFLRYVAVLGDMVELGEASSIEHERLGALLADLHFDAVFCTGPAMKGACQKAKEEGLSDVYWFKDQFDLAKGLVTWVREGDGIFVKGSRAMAMEKIVEFLKKQFQGA